MIQVFQFVLLQDKLKSIKQAPNIHDAYVPERGLETFTNIRRRSCNSKSDLVAAEHSSLVMLPLWVSTSAKCYLSLSSIPITFSELCGVWVLPYKDNFTWWEIHIKMNTGFTWVQTASWINEFGDFYLDRSNEIKIRSDELHYRPCRDKLYNNTFKCFMTEAISKKKALFQLATSFDFEKSDQRFQRQTERFFIKILSLKIEYSDVNFDMFWPLTKQNSFGCKFEKENKLQGVLRVPGWLCSQTNIFQPDSFYKKFYSVTSWNQNFCKFLQMPHDATPVTFSFWWRWVYTKLLNCYRSYEVNQELFILCCYNDKNKEWQRFCSNCSTWKKSKDVDFLGLNS